MEALVDLHSRTDYSALYEDDFISPLTDYVIYNAKKELGIVNANLGEMQIFEAVGNYLSGNTGVVIETAGMKSSRPLDVSEWKEFDLIKLFDMSAGKYYPATDYDNGDTPLISASESNNGTMAYTDLQPSYEGNCLTIGKVGMSIYFQESPFCASSDAFPRAPCGKGHNWLSESVPPVSGHPSHLVDGADLSSQVQSSHVHRALNVGSSVGATETGLCRCLSQRLHGCKDTLWSRAADPFLNVICH